MNNIKSILFVIFFVFSTVLIINNVDAANVCCEKTKDNRYCEYVDQSQCAAGSKVASANCESTSFCKLGCGIDLNDGRCYKNTPYALAISREQTFGNDPNCDLPQCKLGCCILGSQSSLATEARCKKEVANYPELQIIFKADVTDEATCLNLARAQDKGCCKVSRDNCKYITRNECNLATATNETGTGFFKDTYCSDTKLGCDCVSPKKEENKGCLDNEDDVYYFDSCGNPEGVAENCDYTKGTLCGKDDNDGKYKCLPLDCDVTEDFNSVDEWNPSNIKNGESWCESDSGTLGDGTKDQRVGFGRDVPGSRYYNRLCINNKIFTEPCKDLRQERCISTVPGEGLDINGVEYHESKCRTNRYQDCNSCNDNTRYLSEDEMRNCCNNPNIRDCYWQEGNKKCVPFVPPGSKFWAGEGADRCTIANSECEVVIYVSGLRKLVDKVGIGGDVTSFVRSALTLRGSGSEVKIVSGENCLSKDYIIGKNNLCRAQGDCGADFNIVDVDKGTTEGFSSTSNFSGDIQNLLDTINKEPPPKIAKIDLTNWAGSGIPSGGGQVSWFSRWGGPTLIFSTRTLTQAIFGGVWGAGAWQGIKGSLWSGITGKGVAETATVEIGKLFYQEVYREALVNELTKKVTDKALKEAAINTLKDFSTKQLEEDVKNAFGEKVLEEAGKKATSKTLYTIVSGVNIYLTVNTIASLTDTLLSDTVSTKVITTCNSWVAPTGSDDCNKCNPDDPSYIFKGKTGRKCTEYLCKSLGQSCALINQGTGNETCVSQNPNDVNAPILTKWEDVIDKKFKPLEDLNYGYRYKNKIPAFTRFPMAIKTDEPAQCKVSFNLGKEYKDMEVNYFGSPLYSYNHLMLITFPTQEKIAAEGKIQVTSGGDYKLYVRCQDSLGNDNKRDYIIQFTIDEGPDLTPPSIEGTSITNGAFFKNKAQETDLTIFVNERAECKWSNLDTEYNNMENSFTCKNTLNTLSLYECTTKLKPLIDDIENKFYFRCKDKPGVREEDRNVMEQSYAFSLRGSVPLEIRSIEPKGDLFTNNITLRVETAAGAYKDGTSVCGYSDKKSFDSMVQFLNTNSSIHTQQLLLSPGSYNYYVMCVDAGGNIAEANTSIKISVDTEPPRILRIYEDTTYTPSHLKLILNEASNCEYSFSDFNFGSGNKMPEDGSKEHDALFRQNSKYFIRCVDLYGNRMPLTVVYT